MLANHILDDEITFKQFLSEVERVLSRMNVYVKDVRASGHSVEHIWVIRLETLVDWRGREYGLLAMLWCHVMFWAFLGQTGTTLHYIS